MQQKLQVMASISNKIMVITNHISQSCSTAILSYFINSCKQDINLHSLA